MIQFCNKFVLIKAKDNFYRSYLTIFEHNTFIATVLLHNYLYCVTLSYLIIDKFGYD